MQKRAIFNYLFYVFLLSIPFWIVGAMAQEFTQSTPIQLPISALMAICPTLSVLIILLQQKKGHEFIHLLSATFDWRTVKSKKWLIPCVFLMPFIGLISHEYANYRDGVSDQSSFSIPEISIFFAVFFIGAIAEEIGWSGFIKQPMIKEYGALKAGLIIGFIWAIWHLVPYIEMNKTFSWIFIQSVSTILLRIIMVWLFENNNQSLFLMTLFHTMINISPYLFSRNQVNYEPIVFVSTLSIVVFIILLFWETKSFVIRRN
jgi:uncharacterized protein